MQLAKENLGIKINGIQVNCNDNGFYNAHALHKSSSGEKAKGPEEFLIHFPEHETEASHIERKFGSRPGLFFSPWLSVVYASWISIEFFNLVVNKIEKNMVTQAYTLGVQSNESEDIRNQIFNEGLLRGQEFEKEKLNQKFSNMPDHPVQEKSINTLELWREATSQEENTPSDFVNYILLAAQVYRDLGRDDVLSNYDWNAESYWVTPEFAFYILSYFPFGSLQRANGLSYLNKMSNGRVWASSAGE
ncbi:MAG: hypothetical protein KYX60_16215 [Halomonas meridiana]|uniref:hypothetical protein n=1 Tax=Vreelandella aquamarina TaxID=77097 RepID=UPI0024E1F444|nr:hypothetical protein [Halomonas meridiana]MDK2752167.1 hypothetical protein [Halomonas meridiana]